MPPQLIRDTNQNVTGHGGRISGMKVKSNYLGIVAHECHISAVSRQLVVIGLFFSLWGGEQICHPQPHRFRRLCCLQGELVLHITEWNLTNLSLFRNSVEFLARTLCKKTEPWDFLRYSKSVEKDEKSMCEIGTSGNIITMLKCNCHTRGLTYKQLALHTLFGANTIKICICFNSVDCLPYILSFRFRVINTG